MNALPSDPTIANPPVPWFPLAVLFDRTLPPEFTSWNPFPPLFSAIFAVNALSRAGSSARAAVCV
jgi:hypothetical protein